MGTLARPLSALNCSDEVFAMDILAEAVNAFAIAFFVLSVPSILLLALSVLAGYGIELFSRHQLSTSCEFLALETWVQSAPWRPLRRVSYEGFTHSQTFLQPLSWELPEWNTAV